jgi:tRNA threonylcarbamoyladenosine biosynthesis protein TsaE
VRQIARSAQDTEEWGARLARARPAVPELAVVFLTGELGAGKTTLVRGFLRAQGITAAVRSPTYTLVELYRCGELGVLHADLFRLRDPGELEALGLREWAQSGYLWLIEWPERGHGHLPPPDLTLSFRVLNEAHAIDIQTHSILGERWLGNLPPPESSR